MFSVPARNILSYGPDENKVAKFSRQHFKKISGTLMNQRINADPKSFKFKSSIADNANNAGIANITIVVTLKYLESDSHLPKKTFLFVLTIALQK